MPEPRSVVALHGHDDDPATIRPWVARLAGTSPLQVPAGPVRVEDGGRAWFSTGAPGELATMAAAIDGAIDAAAEPPADVVLVGWSQGAAAALAFALRPEAPRLAAVIALAGWLPDLHGIEWSPTDETPILLLHGADDEVVPPLQGRSAARFLERSGANVTWEEVEGDHHVTEAMLDAAARWLAERVG